MKKRVLALMVATALILGFTGCGNGESKTDGSSGDGGQVEDAKKDDTGGDSKEKVVLTVWESTEGPDKFIEQAGKLFTEKNPNIEIKYVNVELNDTTSQIALDGPAGIGADIFAAPHDKLGELATGGHVLANPNAEAIKEKALASSVQALTYDDKMYGYPISAETYALFYNKELISEEEVPKTWEDVKTFAKNFNSGDKYGFMMGVGDAYYTIIFTTSENNRLFGPTGSDTSNTNINSEASIEGMKIFAGLREVLDVPSADLQISITDTAFASGKAALYITGLWNINVFKDAGIDFGVTTLPSLPGNDTPAASFSGTRGMFVSAYSNYPEEANEFLNFLMTDEIQQLRFEITGSLPSTKIEVDSPYVQGFIEQLNYAFPMPSIPQMAKFWDAMNAASKNIWDGADIKTELDACNSAILGE